MMDNNDIDWGIKMLLQENRELKIRITSLEAENAKLKALIERMVDEGEVIAERLSVRGANESELEDWNVVMDEYKAMKGGEA